MLGVLPHATFARILKCCFDKCGGGTDGYTVDEGMVGQSENGDIASTIFVKVSWQKFLTRAHNKDEIETLSGMQDVSQILLVLIHGSAA